MYKKYEDLVKLLKMQANEMMFDFERKPFLAAANAIEDLQKPCWISVTERVPKDCRDVLAYYGFLHDGAMSERRFIGVLSYFATDEVPHWQHEGTGLRVTHWMPLPEPPTDSIPQEEEEDHGA